MSRVEDDHGRDDEDGSGDGFGLSAAAEGRRRDILGGALREADRRRRRRWAARAGASVAACAGLALLARGVIDRVVPQTPGAPQQVAHHAPTDTPTTAILPRPAPAPQSAPVVPVAPRSQTPSPARVASAAIQIEVIRADAPVQKWYETIGDDDLIAALALAGQPGGIVELNGKAMVVPVR